MAEHRRTVDYPPGQQSTGVDVEISESSEQPSRLKLEDGTILRIRPGVADVTRLNDQWDNDGNPVYVVRSSLIVTVIETAEEFKKQAT